MGKWIHRLSNVDLEAKTANCSNCGPVALLHGRRCEYAKREYETSDKRKAINARNKWKKYTDTYFNAWETKQGLLETQDGSCAICEAALTEDNQPQLDHCHTTSIVRGVLCRNCNLGLGMFKDNTEYLGRAIEYLNRF